MNGFPKTVNKRKIEYKESNLKLMREVNWDENGNTKIENTNTPFQAFINQSGRFSKAVGLSINGNASFNFNECMEVNHPEFKNKFKRMIKDRITKNIAKKDKYTVLYSNGTPFKFAID
jgi:hypothetical protein